MRPLRLTSGLSAFVLSTLFWLGSFWVALRVGAVSDADFDLVLQLRLPRVILASAVGMGLSVAGATLQALFTNPLCEPYTLGISSGAALGAVIGSALGYDASYSGLAVPAFVGALLFAGVLSVISRRSTSSQLAVLLAGVMLGLLGSSLVAVWMAVSDAQGIQGALIWLMGSLSRARMEGSILSLFGVITLSLLLWRKWRELDAFLLGEEGALALGVSVQQVRTQMILLTSLLVGLCVSGAGMIGFIGLMIPHFVRRFSGSLHLTLLPLCAIWGATSLNLADSLARTAIAPYELPVGVVTALAGAPFFLSILLKRMGRVEG